MVPFVECCAKLRLLVASLRMSPVGVLAKASASRDVVAFSPSKRAKSGCALEGVEKACVLADLEGAALSAPLWPIRRRRRAALQLPTFLDALLLENL